MEEYVEKNVWKRITCNFFFSPHIHCHPYVWHQDSKSVQALLKGTTGLLHWYFNITLAFLYCSFTQFRSVQLLLDPSSSTIACVLTQLMVVYYVTCSCMIPTYLLRRGDVPRFVNTQVKFMEHISRAYKLNLSGAKQLYGVFGLILEIFQVCCWVNPCFLVAIGIVRPWSPELVSSLMPNAEELGFEWRMLFAVGQSYLLATIVEGFLMLFGFLALLVLTTSGLVSILRDHLRKAEGRIPEETTLRKTLHSHRCLHLQLKDLRSTAGKTVTCANVLILTTAIICSYEAVRLPGIQSLALGLIAANWTTMWLIWLSLLASINSKSAHFLQDAQHFVVRMHGGRIRSALEKELKSIRELRVYMNSSFYYDKLHMLTTIDMIANYMATMTLTL